MTTVPSTSGLFDRRAERSAHERPFEATGDERPTRPNIVFIFADDLGWGDTGAYGSLHHDTPAIDELARGGLRFTHAYAASATCSPTRIGLYTGRYPGRLTAGLEEPLGTHDAEHGIPPEHPTLPSLLRDGGYHTAMFGKWHCGWLPWFSPLKSGFEEFFGNLDGAMDYFAHVGTDGKPDLYEGEEPVEIEGYYTDLVAERAERYILDADSGAPFYMQVNFTTPHWPWEGPTDQAIGEEVAANVEQIGALPALFHSYGGSLEAYSRLVASLDGAVGRVLAALDERGLKDNTIVCFASDNGGERWAFQWPFMGEKGDLEEGGIRVPFIVRWPEAITASQVSDVPNVTYDWTATLLDAAGLAPDAGHPLDGQSLLGWLVDGEGAPERDILWRTREQGAIRRGNYKLVIDRKGKSGWKGLFPSEGPTYELFDVTVDGRERANLAAQHPELVAELRAKWEKLDDELLPYPSPRARPGMGPGFPD